MLKRSSLHVSKGVPDTGTAFHEEAVDLRPEEKKARPLALGSKTSCNRASPTSPTDKLSEFPWLAGSSLVHGLMSPGGISRLEGRRQVKQIGFRSARPLHPLSQPGNDQSASDRAGPNLALQFGSNLIQKSNLSVQPGYRISHYIVSFPLSLLGQLIPTRIEPGGGSFRCAHKLLRPETDDTNCLNSSGLTT